MNFILQRYSDNGQSTQGLLFSIIAQDMIFDAHTLEDEHRAYKVAGETCIPAGLYEIKMRREDSPLTKKYQDRFKWFTYHLQLQDVPDFNYVYIHIGNTEENTDGCILLGSTANVNTKVKGFIGGSTGAFQAFYEDVSEWLGQGDKVYIEVRDLKHIL